MENLIFTLSSLLLGKITETYDGIEITFDNNHSFEIIIKDTSYYISSYKSVYHYGKGDDVLVEFSTNDKCDSLDLVIQYIKHHLSRYANYEIDYGF